MRTNVAILTGNYENLLVGRYENSYKPQDNRIKHNKPVFQFVYRPSLQVVIVDSGCKSFDLQNYALYSIKQRFSLSTEYLFEDVYMFIL